MDLNFNGLTAPPLGLENHFRYLSGMLLAVGLGLRTTIRKPEAGRNDLAA